MTAGFTFQFGRRRGDTVHGILVGLAVIVIGGAFFYRMLKPQPLIGTWATTDGTIIWAFSADNTVATQVGETQATYKWYATPHRLTLIPRPAAGKAVKAGKPIRLTWSLDHDGRTLLVRDSDTKQLYQFGRE